MFVADRWPVRDQRLGRFLTRRRAGYVWPLVLLAISACSQSIDLVPVNQQAEEIGSPRMHLLSFLPGSAANVVMPNGENVTGWLAIDENAPANAPDGNATLDASGPRTKLSCHGLFVAGHGKLTCISATGAAYEVQL